MGGFLMAMLLFATLVAIVTALRADDEAVADFADAPSRLPNPGSRDLHTVTTGTLGRAYVPSWG